MKRLLVVIMVALFLSAATIADACATCGNKNHYNFHNKYGGGSATATANPTITNNVAPVQQQWLNASQTISPGAFTSNFTGGPTTVTTGETKVDVSVTGQGSGIGGGEFSGHIISEFPSPYVTIPAAPLSYNGPPQTVSHFASDQMWFKRPKWTADMVKGLKKGGRIDDQVFEKVSPVKYFYVKDGRNKRLWCADEERNTIMDDDGKKTLGDCKPYKPPQTAYLERLQCDNKDKDAGGRCKLIEVPITFYYLGPVYCDSAKPGEKPGPVWGGCAPRLLEKGCTYSVLEDGLITQGTLSTATNQSGGATLAGIFGSIFGFNVGGGASNTDHTATLEEKVNLTWGCYGVGVVKSEVDEKVEKVDDQPFTQSKK